RRTSLQWRRPWAISMAPARNSTGPLPPRARLHLNSCFIPQRPVFDACSGDRSNHQNQDHYEQEDAEQGSHDDMHRPEPGNVALVAAASAHAEERPADRLHRAEEAQWSVLAVLLVHHGTHPRACFPAGAAAVFPLPEPMPSTSKKV